MKPHIEQLYDSHLTGAVEREDDHSCHQVTGLVTAPECEPDPREHVHVEIEDRRDYR